MWFPWLAQPDLSRDLSILLKVPLLPDVTPQLSLFLVLGMPLFAAGVGAPAHLASYGLDPCLQETGSSPWF